MVTPEKIERYLSGTCTEEESREVEAWYLSFGENADHISTLSLEQKTLLKERLQTAIKEKIREKEPYALAGTPVRKLRTAFIIKVAASLIIALGIVYAAREYLTSTFTTEDAFRQVTNTNQSLQKLKLPDASIVWLYPDTRIEYGALNGDTREVQLTGEAFFEVARDTLRPFLIHSGNLTTRVLGTSFDIKAWPSDPTISVAVKSGKVAVHANHSTSEIPTAEAYMILTSAQKVVFSKEKKELVKEEEALHPEIKIWASASLSFHNAPLPDVVQTLRDQFGVQINIDEKKMGNCTIRADFTDQQLPTIIDLICKSIAAEYSILDNRILISGNGCTTSANPNQPIKKETI